jgi:hypothetical protein
MMSLIKLLFIKRESFKKKEVLEEKLQNKNKLKLEQKKEKEQLQMTIF